MQTYSREFLQSLPDKKKQQEVDAMIKGFWQSMHVTAENGQTSYFFDMTTMRKVAPEPASNRVLQTKSTLNSQTTMTNEEIVTRFQTAFPGCSVQYGEEWVESNASTRVLKRGITIDWS
uniref:Uncharacterized protein n=1 Tax=viral metagenome TaxID=1070528 RepID=A0A6C0AP28_9ZZZZ